MAVSETTTTNGKWRTFTSENATLATAISEVMERLDIQYVPMTMVQFVLTFDDANNKYAYVAIQKLN
jgi:hypothetical protein